MNLKNIFSMLKETFQDWSEDKAPRLAAALSYYTVFSLAPLLVLIIAIAGFVIGNNENVRSAIIEQAQGLLGPQGASAIETMITETSRPRSGILATALGIATLLLGATGVFGQLQEALNTIWEVEPQKGKGVVGVLKDRFLSFTMVLGTCFLLLVSLVISAAIAAINGYLSGLFSGAEFIAQIINFVISTGVVTLIFALIFKILPDVHIEWRDVWVGALVTALLFNIGKTLLGVYLGNSATTSVYGAAGSLVIILLWVYYTAQILFLGAEFTQVYARRYGSKLVPEGKARQVTDEERLKQGMPPKPASREPQPAASIQQVMIPVAGQPEIYHRPPRERVRYEPPQPGKVVPVIALGVAAGVYTLRRIIRRYI